MCLFFFDLLLFLQFCIIEGSNITHGNRQFLSLIAQLPVLGISRFLPGEQFRVLRVQFFYLRKFLYPKLIKGLLGRLVKRDFFPMRLKELLAVTSLPVSTAPVSPRLPQLSLEF